MFVLFLKYLFVVLHVITAAAWFGLGLRLGGQARTAAERGGVAGRALADDAQRTVRLMGIMIVLTFLFALGAFFAGGGFGVYGPVYHTSLLLILVLVGVQFFVIRPGWVKLHTLLAEAAGTDVDLAGPRKRVAMGVGVGHLLWLVLLVLMFWEEFSAAL